MGPFAENAGTDKRVIVEAEKIGYRFIFEKIIIAVLFFAVGCVSILFLMGLGLEKFQLPSTGQTIEQSKFSIRMFIVIIFAVTTLFVLLFKTIVRKKVILTEIGDETFELLIGREKISCQKTALRRVDMIQKQNRHGDVKRRILLLGIRDRSFRFVSKGNREELDIVYRHLERWKKSAEGRMEMQAGDEGLGEQIKTGIVLDKQKLDHGLTDEKLVEKLSYSKVPFLRVAVATLFSIVGFFVFIIFMVIGLAIFGISERPEGDLQGILFVVVMLVSGLIAATPFFNLFDKVFQKEISLVDLGNNTFELTIGIERYVHQKAAIQKVSVRKRRSKYGSVTGYILTLKAQDQVFRFGSGRRNDKTMLMYERLNQWQQEGEKATPYKSDIELT